MPVAEKSNLAVARSLLREVAAAALGTIGEHGEPFVSHVLAAIGAEAEPLLLLSGLARHTRNLGRDPRASLLLVGTAAEPDDPMTAPRLTLTGPARTEPAALPRQAFLDRHPSAAVYAGFTDFALFRLHVENAYLVAGFGRIVEISPAELRDQEEAGLQKVR